MALVLPAEWEKHEATWLTWPKRADDWPGKFATIKWVYAEIIKIISRTETVKLIVDSKQQEKKAVSVLKKSGVDLKNVEFFHILTDRSWIRDYGPFFVRSEHKIKALNFKFTGWARYKDWINDNKIPAEIASVIDICTVNARHKSEDVVLEGGSIDVNGSGTLITTKQCLLSKENHVRNPGFTVEDYESIFKKYFGIKNTIWLNGGIEGDDTNGHIDDICRFVNSSTVVACHEHDKGDFNHKPLEENLNILKHSRLEDGSRLNIIKLPMPEPKYFEGFRLPASYANFYISNAGVLVPTFNDPNDYKAIGIFREIFRGRKVVGINCTDLIWGLGTIHCMTKEQNAQS